MGIVIVYVIAGFKIYVFKGIPMNFRFEYLEAFHYFWFLLAFVPLLLILRYKKQKNIKSLFGKTLPFLTRTTSMTKQNIKLVLECLVFTLLVLAYARPQFGEDTQTMQRSGVEIVFAIDTSLSMLTEDIKPNRLDLAKRTLHRILDQSVGHKIGLVAFAGSAALISPITSDYSALAMYIDAISTSLIQTQGTRFTQALLTSADSFKKGEEEVQELSSSQVIIIISDGEDNEPGALELASKLANDGLHIYTMAVGTEKGAPIPIRDDLGQLQDYKKDKSQNIVLSRSQDKLLRNIASIGKGQFTYASIGGDEVKLLMDDLDQLEKRKFEEDQFVNAQEQFQIILALALLLMFLEIMLSERISYRK